MPCGYCDKHHELGGSEGQSVFCRRSGGWTSTGKLSVAPCSLRDQQGGPSWPRLAAASASLSSACGRATPAFPWQSPCGFA